MYLLKYGYGNFFLGLRNGFIQGHNTPSTAKDKSKNSIQNQSWHSLQLHGSPDVFVFLPQWPCGVWRLTFCLQTFTISRFMHLPSVWHITRSLHYYGPNVGHHPVLLTVILTRFTSSAPVYAEDNEAQHQSGPWLLKKDWTICSLQTLKESCQS